MKAENSAVISIGCMTILMLPLFAVWRSFVATKLWSWFVVAAFGLPQLSMPMAFGLVLVVGMFVPHASSDTKDEGLGRVVGKIIGLQLLWPAIVLLLGHITMGLL